MQPEPLQNAPRESEADFKGMPQELADLLRHVHFAMKQARTALVATIPSERLDFVRRDIERLGEAMKAVDAALVGAPEPLPLTPEQEERARVWIGRALDRLDG